LQRLPCCTLDQREDAIVTPAELAEQWRTEAGTLDRYEPSMAKVCRDHADALDAALRSVADDTLDLTTAARESGYSVDRLRHLVADGALPNAGHKGKPRIRRGDLPMKSRSGTSLFDAASIARSLIRRA
jgi:hypothetical protein